MVLNENALYKDKLAKGSSRNKQTEKEKHVELEETSKDDIIKPVGMVKVHEAVGSLKLEIVGA